MQFDSQKSFGYPVLRRPSNDDYVRGHFQPSIRPRRVDKDDVEVEIECLFAVGIPELSKLIEQKKAAFSIVVDCRDTFHREFFKTFDKEVIFKCDASLFKGLITFEAYITAEENIDEYYCEYIHPDFGTGPFSFSTGAVLAQDEEQQYFVINEKFKSLESLINLVVDENLQEGEWHFDILQDRPVVSVSKELQNQMTQKGAIAQAIVVNSVLVPVVSKMIDLLMDDDTAEECSRYPWSNIVLDGLEKRNLTFNSKNGDSIRLAQQFLNLPFKKFQPFYKDFD